MCSALQLRDVLTTPEDWEQIGRYLADAAVKIFGNGSHQFIGEAVPALVDSGLVRTKEDLIRGIDTLLDTINYGFPALPPEKRYNGGNEFSTLAEQMLEGNIASFDDIRKAYPRM